MYSFQKLALTGYRQEPVPHTFFQQHEESQHAAIVLAGRANSCQHPTLYYPTRELLRRGADVLLVDYCLRSDFATFSDEELKACIEADALAAARALLQRRSYRQVTLVGKSLGTLAMGYLLSLASSMPQLQTIWLTPLIKLPELCTQIQQFCPRSLFVIGTADPHYDRALLAELEKATSGRTLEIEGADHLLEVPDGITSSLQAMEQIMQSIQMFLDSSDTAR